MNYVYQVLFILTRRVTSEDGRFMTIHNMMEVAKEREYLRDWSQTLTETIDTHEARR